MNIILFGTSSWVIPIFDRISREHNVVAVFTRAPKPAGRKQELQKSPVHLWAESRGIPTETTIKNIFDYNLSDIDYAVVASYGVIIRDDVLAAVKCINVHPSALPKYRGAAPITTAIYNGDTRSAVCIMNVAHDVDAGDILMRREFAIGENDTNETIEKLVGDMGADMVCDFLRAPERFPPMPQIGIPTFTRKWTGADEIIDWKKSPMDIHNMVRAIGGRTKINGRDVKVLETKITNGKLEILRVQPSGGKPMDWKSFVNGQRGIIQFNGTI